MRVPATITIDSVVERTWDAIVIGAGPAGAVTARQLARRGCSVLLVERKSFPREKVCGGYLNGEAVSVLGSIGMQEPLLTARPIAARRLALHASGRQAELELSSGLIVSRARFDAALVRAAIQAGADFLCESWATVTGRTDPNLGFQEVQLSHRGGAIRKAKGRVIVAADGLGHACLPRAADFACHARPDSRVGLGITIRDDSPAFKLGTIYMGISREGYVGIARSGPEDLNLAAALDAVTLKTFGDPATAVKVVLHKSGLPQIRLVAADGWRGTPPLTRSSEHLAASRVFLVGDSAGYVEPFTGEGMAWAITSAVLAVPKIVDNLTTWDERSVRAWEEMERRRMRDRQLACRVLATLLRRPHLVGLAVQLLAAVPAVARPLVRRISAKSIDWRARSA